MGESSFALLFVLFILVAAGIAAYAHYAKVQRQREMGALATNQGLVFSIDDPFGTLGEPFTFLERGDGRGVENVMWGTWHGLEVRAFDYWYYEESTDSRWIPGRSCTCSVRRRPSASRSPAW